MSNITKRTWEAFCEGFVGAFRLYVALIMAPFRIMRAFINHEPLK